MTRTITLTADNFQKILTQVKDTLSTGGLVVFPSDTVYGLLVDATNENAVKKLITFKNRAQGKAISVFISDLDACKKYVQINKKQEDTLATLLPGPFTMVLPSKHCVQKLLESETGTLGVRVPDFQPVLLLAKSFGKPITATSVNLGGKSPHYSIDSFLHQIPQSKKELIDLIVDAGKLPRNKPSTVLDLTEPTVKTLRKGDISMNNVERHVSKSPHETQRIGKSLIQKLKKNGTSKPIVIVLKGDLGAGKTEMTRGIAEYFAINKIISPTFVIYYEYDVLDKKSKFVHVDLYNIQEEGEFDHLGLTDYLKEDNVLVVEWGEKLGNMYNQFKSKAEVVFVEIEYYGEKGRKIVITYDEHKIKNHTRNRHFM